MPPSNDMAPRPPTPDPTPSHDRGQGRPPAHPDTTPPDDPQSAPTDWTDQVDLGDQHGSAQPAQPAQPVQPVQPVQRPDAPASPTDAAGAPPAPDRSASGRSTPNRSTPNRLAAGELALIEAARLQAHHRSRPALRSASTGGAIPGYRILRELHRGGQGVVYLAVQEGTRRKVAMKVMREGPLTGGTDRVRFEREVQVLAQINNPNIVAIHDSGVYQGSHYFVMDYISGHPLDEYVRLHGLDHRAILALFVEICNAVNAAHLRGVIHRDLKPGNIRVTPQGAPKILDFGLAKVAEDRTQHGPTMATQMTQTGQFIGSLPWTSPEQARGESAKIDVRTDVYALGVMLYQVFCGRFPYRVEGPMPQVIDAICRAAPVRPRQIDRAISGELEVLILKPLAKERELRYQTAGEFARDIERYLAGEPIEAKRGSWRYLSRKLILRHRVPLAIGGAALIAIILLVGVALGGLRSETDLRDELRALRARAAELEARNEALQAEIRALRSSAGPPPPQAPLIDR